MPVPRPVTRAGGVPVNQAIRAADAVVLPIPMSPVTSRSAPSSISVFATSAPTSSAALASLTDIAGPWAKSSVPGRTLRSSNTGFDVSGEATPTSITTRRAPCWRARTLIAAPPAQKFATICAVTSCGHGVTPERTTPWSAANTATAGCSGTGGGTRPAMPASCTPRSSMRPSEPAGLINRSCSMRAPARAAMSGGRSAVSASWNDDISDPCGRSPHRGWPRRDRRLRPT